MADQNKSGMPPLPAGEAERRAKLPQAARRALEEADERRARALAAGNGKARPPEIGGRDGPEPTRYGDWEVKGIVSDF